MRIVALVLTGLLVAALAVLLTVLRHDEQRGVAAVVLALAAVAGVWGWQCGRLCVSRNSASVLHTGLARAHSLHSLAITGIRGDAAVRAEARWTGDAEASG